MACLTREKRVELLAKIWAAGESATKRKNAAARKVYRMRKQGWRGEAVLLVDRANRLRRGA